MLADAESLRRVAAPDRIAIYDLLLRDGPKRVSDVAAALGMAVGSASHHVRVLSEEGFLRPNAHLIVDRRSRYWEAIPGGIRWRAPDGGAPSNLVSAVVGAQAAVHGRRDAIQKAWIDSSGAWPASWQSAATDVDSVLRLDAAEAVELQTELLEVLNRWRERPNSRPDSREVMVAVQVIPIATTRQIE